MATASGILYTAFCGAESQRRVPSEACALYWAGPINEEGIFFFLLGTG
jgi:hypothetical protein